jgi:hypothetical protein
MTPISAQTSAIQAEPSRPLYGTIGRVQKCWIAALNANRRSIRHRWEALLRLERADTPIADPENLVHLIDWTLEEIFKQLRNNKASHGTGANTPLVTMLRAECHCGCNPLIKHFLAGEQALLEAMIILQANESSFDPRHRASAVTELYLAIREVARSEIGSLCALCTRPRAKAPGTSDRQLCPVK